MNGRRAKIVRMKARILNGGSEWSSFERRQHPPKAVVNMFGVVVSHSDSYTDRCEGFRGILRDLKRLMREMRQREQAPLEKNLGRRKYRRRG